MAGYHDDGDGYYGGSSSNVMMTMDDLPYYPEFQQFVSQNPNFINMAGGLWPAFVAFNGDESSAQTAFGMPTVNGQKYSSSNHPDDGSGRWDGVVGDTKVTLPDGRTAIPQNIANYIGSQTNPKGVQELLRAAAFPGAAFGLSSLLSGLGFAGSVEGITPSAGTIGGTEGLGSVNTPYGGYSVAPQAPIDAQLSAMTGIEPAANVSMAPLSSLSAVDQLVSPLNFMTPPGGVPSFSPPTGSPTGAPGAPPAAPGAPGGSPGGLPFNPLSAVPSALNALSQSGGSGAGGGGNPLSSLAGIGTGLYDLFAGGNKVDPSKMNTLWQAGLDTYNMARDPQQALYGRTAQQLQDQTRAGQSARGVAMSPYGAAGEADVMKNFNIDWANNQLGRQVQGYNALEGATGGYFRQANTDQTNRNAAIQSGTNALLTGANQALAPGGWLSSLWNSGGTAAPAPAANDPYAAYWNASSYGAPSAPASVDPYANYWGGAAA